MNKSIVKWLQRVWIPMTRWNGQKTMFQLLACMWTDVCNFNPFCNGYLRKRDFVKLSNCDNDVFHPKNGMNKNYSDLKTPVNNHVIKYVHSNHLKPAFVCLHKYVQHKVEKKHRRLFYMKIKPLWLLHLFLFYYVFTENLALHQPAWQSITFSSYTAYLVVDGQYTGQCA